MRLNDPRIWRAEGACTKAVVEAAASARCTTDGFDVDDLIARAARIVRPEPTRHTQGNTVFFVCDKCGLLWHEGTPETHRPGC